MRMRGEGGNWQWEEGARTEYSLQAYHSARRPIQKEQIRMLHGSRLDLNATTSTNPLRPALAPVSEDLEGGSAGHAAARPGVGGGAHPGVRATALFQVRDACCGPASYDLARSLDGAVLGEIGAWIDEKTVDLVLVVGLAATNTDTANLGTARDLKHGDFIFVGDEAELSPKLFEPIINPT
ncbi:hypothetical protein F4802DRAFT_599238 [Xylaria palmicola]|nr:hypothetical protein F4802DRAFT_599238 [Xylaria palmicola]